MATGMRRSGMLSSQLLEDVEDFVDVKGMFERWSASLGSCSTHDLFDLYQRTIEQLTEFEVEAAYALGVPSVASAVRGHAEAMRRLTSAYSQLARTVLKA